MQPGAGAAALQERLLAARAAAAAGNPTEAIRLLREVLSLQPAVHDVRGMLGALLLQTGQLAEAEQALIATTRALPGQPDHWVNLAACLLAAGRSGEALAALKTAHQLQPSHLGAWLVLARARLFLGDAAGAERCLRAAESLSPQLPDQAWFQLAGVLQERKAFDEAKPYYLRAIEQAPHSFLYRSNYADMLCSIGELDEGLAQHRAIVAREPDRLRSHLALNLTLPGVHASAAALAEAREGFAQGIEHLHERLPAFRARPDAEIEADIRWSNYLLAYQGQDDLALQQRFSSFQQAVLQGRGPLAGSAPAGSATRRDGRIRIGFASSFFYQCTVGWYFSSWIRDLDRTRFDVHVYSLGPTQDALSRELMQDSTFRQAHHLPLFGLARMMLEDGLDVLVFPELGLCPTTFTLASMRLAPLQCAGWGHPVTSGHSTIDVYFSSDLIEPAEAAAHYSEALIRLPGLGTRYPRAGAASPVSRERFGLPADRPLALVSQSLFKIHPDNDPLYAAVRERVPASHFLFFEDSFARNTALFESRLAGIGLERGRHFTFLPRMSRAEFLGVNMLADVMLDTLHWSGGNTSLDALSVGLPVVTLPGRFMRGRQSLGMLSAMGCTGLVAQDESEYSLRAAELLTSRSTRDAWREQILRANGVLYEQPDATRAFQTALLERVDKARAG